MCLFCGSVIDCVCVCFVGQLLCMCLLCGSVIDCVCVCFVGQVLIVYVFVLWVSY